MKKILFAVIFLFSASILFIFPKWTVDDAYISYRYAEHWARFGQLTWNVGEAPVEGYTGIALPAVTALAIKLGFSPEVVSHVCGVITYFLALVMLILLCREIGIKTTGQLTAGALFAATPILFTHALSGLETMWFLGLMLLSLYLFAKNINYEKSHFWLESGWLVSLLALSLTRPEGVLISGLSILAYIIILSRSQQGRVISFLVRSVIFYAIPAVGYFAWRYNYYGYLLPNTFYAKSAAFFGLANFMDMSRFLVRYFTVPVMVCLLFLGINFNRFVSKLKGQESTIKKKTGLAVLLVLFFFVFILIIQFAHTHLRMNYAYRFYVPLLPLAWILIACIIDVGWGIVWESKSQYPKRYVFILVLCSVAIVYQTVSYGLKLSEEITFAREEKIMIESTHSNVGKLLKQIIPSNEWLVVYMDAGAIPYFSGLKTVDFGDLNDTLLTHGKLSPTARVDYFFSRNPGAVVITSDEPDRVVSNEEVATIMKDSRFGQYTLYKTYSTPPSIGIKYNEFLFIRKDLLKKIAV